jgi:hypothetical protein
VLLVQWWTASRSELVILQPLRCGGSSFLQEWSWVSFVRECKSKNVIAPSTEISAVGRESHRGCCRHLRSIVIPSTCVCSLWLMRPEHLGIKPCFFPLVLSIRTCSSIAESLIQA